MTEEHDLTKVYVDLPNHWATGGESMWARPVGEHLFELRNTPFYAYDLNFLDVVRAVSPSEDVKPHVLAVVRRSGHETLRIFFDELVDSDARTRLLDGLVRFSVSYEGCSPRYFALDVSPNGDVPALRAHLDDLQRQGLVAYETCEARVEGSFDDAATGDEAG